MIYHAYSQARAQIGLIHGCYIQAFLYTSNASGQVPKDTEKPAQVQLFLSKKLLNHP
jgi:hypothetical protein